MGVATERTSLGDLLKQALEGGDPDREGAEYDVWIESGCGRSSETATIKMEPQRVDLGVWQGKKCRARCLQLCFRRVGHTGVQAHNGDIFDWTDILDGTPLQIQVRFDK